jgi:hypothetical protein
MLNSFSRWGIDLRDRLGTQQAHVAGDPPPVEFLFVLLLVFPAADSHDLPQGPMVLGEILELVVVAVAAEACRRQHQDFPVAHAGPAAAGAGVRDNFDWRALRGLGKLLAYGIAVAFTHARSTRWKRRREFRHSSLPSR